VIVLIENNGYGLSTPSREQFRHAHFVDKAPGYGIEGFVVDGNNILEVYTVTRRVAETTRRSRRPVLLEAMTFRMRGTRRPRERNMSHRASSRNGRGKTPSQRMRRFCLIPVSCRGSVCRRCGPSSRR